MQRPAAAAGPAEPPRPAAPAGGRERGTSRGGDTLGGPAGVRLRAAACAMRGALRVFVRERAYLRGRGAGPHSK
eukprot:5069388-Prymnesium_polylepis.1